MLFHNRKGRFSFLDYSADTDKKKKGGGAEIHQKNLIHNIDLQVSIRLILRRSLVLSGKSLTF
jgi:hypothetical protein